MPTKLEKKAGQKPLWSQLYDILQERIEQGTYAEGLNMPTEAELMEEFSVSRVTVRQAMESLLRDGYISRRRGSGTIVRPRRRNAYTTYETTILGEEHNARNDRRIITVGFSKVPSETSAFFQTPPNQPLLRLERRSYIDGKPVANFITYLHPRTAIAETMDFSGSLYEVMEAAGYPITGVTESITADLSTPLEESIFELKKTAAILHRRRFGYSNGEPVECSYASYTGTDYEFTITQK